MREDKDVWMVGHDLLSVIQYIDVLCACENN